MCPAAHTHPQNVSFLRHVAPSTHRSSVKIVFRALAIAANIEVDFKLEGLIATMILSYTDI